MISAFVKNHICTICLLIFLFFSGKSLGQNSDIPLITSQNDTSRYIIFHITGDGGWRGFDIKLAEEFTKNHIPYVCLNSFKYFWSSKTPDQLVKDFAPVMNEYLKNWKKKEIILTGFSFGAEIIPFLYTRLPDDIKARVKMVVIITPAASSDFTIHLTDMMGVDHQYAYNVVKEVEKIKNVKILAIFGEKETSTFPSNHKQDNCKMSFVKGSHHFTDGLAVMSLINNELKQ